MPPQLKTECILVWVFWQQICFSCPLVGREKETDEDRIRMGDADARTRMGLDRARRLMLDLAQNPSGRGTSATEIMSTEILLNDQANGVVVTLVML